MAAYNSMPALSVAPGAGPDTLGLGGSVSHHHPSAAGGLGLDAFDQDLGFDDALLDNVNGLPLPPFTPTYDFETFSTTFEDPFPYSSSAAATAGHHAYELAPHNEGFHASASPQDEALDNKLLGFSAPAVKAAVVDENGQFAEPAMTAELFGMFFLAEDVYAAENTGRPLELTCYRRNLWWCSGQITLPRQVTHVVTEQGRHAAVLELAASISAMESIEGKPTEIICIPWKSAGGSSSNGSTGASNGAAAAAAAAAALAHDEARDAAAAAAKDGKETKAAGSPPRVPVDLANGQDMDNGRVSVPVSWKRLQFKHATANNGRRKGQQQHYVVQINLLGRIQSAGGSGGSGGSEWIKIAEIQSGPVIVRGRSPRNFVSSRREVPLTGSSGGLDKKPLPQPQQQQHLQLDRHSISSASGKLDLSMHPAQQQHRSNSSGVDMAQAFQRYSLMGGMQPSNEWAMQSYAQAQQSPHPAKKLALSPTQTRPPVPAWSNDGPSKATAKATKQQQQQQQQQQPASQPQPQKQQKQQQQQHPMQRSNSMAVPLNLSLSEDERSPPCRTGSDPPSNSPPFASLGGGGGRSSSLALPVTATAASAAAAAALGAGTGAAAAQSDAFENGDLLYEYFPLSLDDWMPPVDAIYRPHVVHHTIVPPEVKAQQVRSKTKRYFAAE